MFPGIRMLFVYSDDDLVAVSSAHASLSLSLNASLSLSLGIAACASLCAHRDLARTRYDLWV